MATTNWNVDSEGSLTFKQWMKFAEREYEWIRGPGSFTHLDYTTQRLPAYGIYLDAVANSTRITRMLCTIMSKEGLMEKYFRIEDLRAEQILKSGGPYLQYGIHNGQIPDVGRGLIPRSHYLEFQRKIRSQPIPIAPKPKPATSLVPILLRPPKEIPSLFEIQVNLNRQPPPPVLYVPPKNRFPVPTNRTEEYDPLNPSIRPSTPSESICQSRRGSRSRAWREKNSTFEEKLSHMARQLEKLKREQEKPQDSQEKSEKSQDSDTRFHPIISPKIRTPSPTQDFYAPNASARVGKILRTRGRRPDPSHYCRPPRHQPKDGFDHWQNNRQRSHGHSQPRKTFKECRNPKTTTHKSLEIPISIITPVIEKNSGNNCVPPTSDPPKSPPSCHSSSNSESSIATVLFGPSSTPKIVTPNADREPSPPGGFPHDALLTSENLISELLDFESDDYLEQLSPYPAYGKLS